ncbi:MAG: hypothetical protein JJU36_11540 [Phycisphaeraceae bacterium]|nr:hypothetical protein [Phycisphaeraceae bacterium]
MPNPLHLSLTALPAIFIALLLGSPAFCAPTNNPVERFGLAWADALPWSNVVNIREIDGRDWASRLDAAQEKLGRRGGVVFFPAGTYEFNRDIIIRDRIILRGQCPEEQTDARKEDYRLASRIQFPKFRPSLEGDGTPHDSSFRRIRTADPETDSNLGVVNLHIDYGTIEFADGEDFKAGRNRLVFGCILTHAIRLNPNVPDREIGQHAWQRYPLRHHGAINIFTEENALAANNRLPPSTDHYRMPGYLVQSRQGPVEFNVLFDFDNRSGIRINTYAIGGAGTRDPHGTPETHPQGFRKGIIIRENYIWHTGRGAIAFSADGANVSFNVSRMEPNFQRFTHTGMHQSYGSSTNGNRAMMIRGWNNHIEGNDYTVYRNTAADGVYPINCGEGLMHEGHANSTIRNLTMLNNRGNAYLSLYKTAGIDGLRIEGNDIRTHGGISAIYVDSDRTWDRHPVRNVQILNNTTAGSGITISGEPAENNNIRGNRHIGDEPGAIIIMAEDVKIEENRNYRIEHRELRLRTR